MDAMMKQMMSMLGIGDFMDPKIMEERLLNLGLPSHDMGKRFGGANGASDLHIGAFALSMHSLANPWMYAVLRSTFVIGAAPWKGTKWFYHASAPCKLPLNAPLVLHSTAGEAKARAVKLSPESVREAKMKYLYVHQEGGDEEEGFLADKDLLHEEIELDLRHPGDLPEEEALKPSINTRYQPVTTKACRHLYQIHFVTPEGEDIGEVVAAYPLQLAVRVDPEREMLIYDACDHTPTLIQDFAKITKQRAYEIPRDYEQLTELDDRNTPGGVDLKRLFFQDAMHQKDRESSQYYAPPKPVNDGDATEEVPGSKQRLLNFKANFCDLSESRVFRTRFPLSSIIGLRLQAGAKTESHLPVPHVLILELSSPVPPEGFAVRSVNPKEQRHVGWSTCADWTPDCTASSGTRHYIYGDEKELRELALYLLKISPGLSAMYRSPNNTLMTSQVCLLPSGAPRARARAHQGSSSAAGGPQGLQCPGGKSFPSQWGPIPGLAGWQKEFEETIFHRRLNPECKCLMPISEEDVSQIGQFVKVQGQVPLPELAIVGLTVVCDALGLDLESCGGDDSNDEEEDEEFEDESESSKWETDDEDEQEEEDVGPSRDLPSRRIDLCAFCDSPEAKLCAGCKEIRYCSLQCQKSDWKTHKADCKQAQARAAAQSAQQEPAVPVAENQRRILKAKRNPLKEQRLNL